MRIQYTFNCSAFLLSAFIDYDISALNDQEVKAVKDFTDCIKNDLKEGSQQLKFITFDCAEPEQKDFAKCEVLNIHSDCAELTAYVEYI